MWITAASSGMRYVGTAASPGYHRDMHRCIIDDPSQWLKRETVQVQGKETQDRTKAKEVFEWHIM